MRINPGMAWEMCKRKQRGILGMFDLLDGLGEVRRMKKNVFCGYDRFGLFWVEMGCCCRWDGISRSGGMADIDRMIDRLILCGIPKRRMM